MRAERTKENMKELQSKPHISENSRHIALHSKRAKENAEVIERLLSPDAKRVLFSSSIQKINFIRESSLLVLFNILKIKSLSLLKWFFLNLF